ncbi:hypothetical protein [Nocardia sp. GTS18]|uniref:hypothetical protein n=1 Tax=Nocardia sp. GTS18 TaxID=1778064 RepID=UPI0015EE88CE|nr:hypothetical protein [Nocardia sp. GTS18]
MSDFEEPAPDDTPAPDPEQIEDAESEANKIRERATDAERRRESRASANARLEALGSISGQVSLTAHNVFLGDAQVGTVIGRDNYGGGFGAGFERSGLVEPRKLHELEQIFVPPPGFEQLCNQLAAQSVLLLRAPKGWGRTATALRALSRGCTSGVHKLSPDVELRSLDIEFERCTGYLFDTPHSQQLRTLSEFHLEQLGRRLAEVESRLVVVVDDQAELSPDAGSFVMHAGDPADVTAILRQHLRQQLADDELGVLSRLEVVTLLTMVTEHRPSAHELVNLAAQLVDVAAGRIDIAEVSGRYAAAEDTRFREWFDELDTDTRSFAVALAVFNKMPLHIVFEASRALTSSIFDAEPLDDDDVRSGQTVFGVRSTELLSKAQAQSYRSHEDTLYGQIAVDVVRFVDERFPQRLLEYMWREYPSAHRVVRDWLGELGSADDLRVSTRAGVAVGLLSTFEFEYARRLVIEPWADSSRQHDQYAAIGALQFSSLQPELAPLVAEMLEAWVEPTQPMARRVTATAALGSTVGQLMPDRALRLLRRSARSFDPDLRDAVCYSIVELFTSPGLDVRVLRDLRRWTVSRRRGVRYTGFLCILQLSFDLTVETPGGVQPWPQLVWLADQYDEHRDHIVVLFARLMQAPYFPPAVHAEIKRWVLVAERDPQFRRPLGRLLVDLEAADQNNGVVPFHLREWADEDGGPRAAVDELLTMLDAKLGV